MKQVIITIGLSIIALYGFAQQDIKVPLSSPGQPGTLEVGLIYGSIIVEAYDGQEVIISTIERKSKVSRRKKSKRGLNRVSGGSADYEVEENNNRVTIGSHFSSAVDFKIKVPKEFSLDLNTINDGNIIVTGVAGDIEVSNTNGGITLNDVSGAVSADALNDDIKVSFVDVDSEHVMVFSNLNGDIDISVPPTTALTLKMKSDMGDIYTDFDTGTFSSESELHKEKNSNNGYRVQIEKWTSAKLNGGGAIVKCKTFNGDIIIREK